MQLVVHASRARGNGSRSAVPVCRSGGCVDVGVWVLEGQRRGLSTIGSGAGNREW